MKNLANYTGRLFFDYSKETYGEWEVLHTMDKTFRWFKCINGNTGKYRIFTNEYIKTRGVY